MKHQVSHMDLKANQMMRLGWDVFEIRPNIAIFIIKNNVIKAISKFGKLRDLTEREKKEINL